MPFSLEDEFLTVDDLAVVPGVSRSTVYAWRYTGVGPRAVRVGRHLRFSRPDVERWLESHADDSPDAA